MNKKLILAVVSLFFITNLFAQASSSSEPSTAVQEKKAVTKATKPVKKEAHKHNKNKAVAHKSVPVAVKSAKTKPAAGSICSTCTYPDIKSAVPVLLSQPIVASAKGDDTSFKIRPVVTLSGGASFMNKGSSASYGPVIGNMPPEPIMYKWNGSDIGAQFVGGIFLGVELPIIKSSLYPVYWQTGLSYYSPFSNQKISGTVSEGTVGGGAASSYNYQLRTQQLFFDNKFLTTIQGRYHPYVSLGLGLSFNGVSNYQSTALVAINPPITPITMSNKTSTQFAYSLGAGMDVDLDFIPHLENWRLGVGYRYLNLGSAAFGNIERNQQFALPLPYHPLKTNNLITQQVLVQLSYVF